MKDISDEALESSRPSKSVEHCLNFCINRLKLDDDHEIEEEIVEKLTFEELIGALLLARDTIEELNDEIDELTEEN